eukprot:ctg_2487.g558
MHGHRLHQSDGRVEHSGGDVLPIRLPGVRGGAGTRCIRGGRADGVPTFCRGVGCGARRAHTRSARTGVSGAGLGGERAAGRVPRCGADAAIAGAHAVGERTRCTRCRCFARRGAGGAQRCVARVRHRRGRGDRLRVRWPSRAHRCAGAGGRLATAADPLRPGAPRVRAAGLP